MVKLIDYEIREDSVLCKVELLSDNGSAVKKSKKGKIMSIWVEKAPKKLFVGRDYLLPSDNTFDSDISEIESESIFVSEIQLIWVMFDDYIKLY